MKAKTTITPKEAVVRHWHLIDLSGQTLGRISTQIAELLIGKNKADYSYHLDDGDYVVVINAAQIQVTGKKPKQKIYYHHTAFAGHLKELSYQEMMVKDPTRVIYHSVLGMLPKNRLRDQRMTRLKIFVDAKHPYQDKLTK